MVRGMTSSVPEDLCVPAIKAARRLQALPVGRLHVVIVVKVSKDLWLQFVLSGQGFKVEKLVTKEDADT